MFAPLERLLKSHPALQFLFLNSISIGGTVAGMGFGYLYQFLCARTLSLAEYGVLGVLVGIWSSLTLPLSSITSVLVRELAKLQGSPAHADFVLLKYMKKTGIYSAVFAIVAAVLSYFLGQPLLALLLLGVPAMVVVSVSNAWLQVRERILELTLVQQGQNVLKVMALTLFLWLGWGLAGAVLTLPVYALLLLAILLIWLLPHLHSIPARTEIHLGHAFLVLLLWQFLSQLSIYEDLFAVKYFLGDEPAGLYNAAEITAKILVFLGTAIGLVLLPKIAKMKADDVRSKGLTLLALSMALLVPVFIGFQLLGQPFMLLFFGPSFAASVPPFLVLSIGMLLAAWAQLIGLFLLARGEENGLLLTFGLALALNALVQWAVVPSGGLIGAAWGVSGVMLLLVLTLGVLLYKRLSDGHPKAARILPAPVEASTS